MIKFILLCLVGSVLTGCLSTQPGAMSTNASETTSARYTSNSEQDNGLVSGMQIEISDPAFPQKVKAIIGQKYFSALGLDCFKVTIAQASQFSQQAALCQKNSGGWSFAPPVWSEASTGGR